MRRRSSEALAIPALAHLFLFLFATFTWGRFDQGRDLAAAAFLVFTLLAVPSAVLVVVRRPCWLDLPGVQRGNGSVRGRRRRNVGRAAAPWPHSIRP